MKGVSVKKIVEKMNLKILNPEIDIRNRKVTTAEVNRPALQLAGYFDYFEKSRIEIVGKVEHTYMQKLQREEKLDLFEKFFSHNIPCVIFSRNLEPDADLVRIATEHDTPVLSTDYGTSAFMAELIYYLGEALAPCISIHGVLVDVYGEGLLIMGESGIGKSEAALELVKRGHRLVTDDVVEIRKINEHTLVGTSPEITRYFIELRGIGIINVKTLFGVECVKEKQNIDLVIKLSDWRKEDNYDRFGMEEEYTEILGNQVVCHSLPIRPGRNLAVICEAAAVNHRQKKMGYNAAQELYRRVQANFEKNSENE